DEVARTDDEAPLEVPAGHQLLDEEPGHDRLAGARVVGEQEAQRLAGKHDLVDRGDLVRQRVHERGMNSEQWVEEVREASPMGLGGEAKGRAVPGEARRAALVDDLEPRLVVAVEDLLGQLPGRIAVGPREMGITKCWANRNA